MDMLAALVSADTLSCNRLLEPESLVVVVEGGRAILSDFPNLQCLLMQR